MKALVFEEKGGRLTPTEIPDPVPRSGEVIVDLHAAAFNRRDFWIQQGMYPNVEYPVVPGGDGAGVLDDREVVVDAGIGWGEDQRVQSDDYYLVGSPGQGTFAQKIAVPRQNVYAKPSHLSLLQASALPVAGVTAYRALFTRGGGKSGERVLITGAGGGVALTALQFAVAAGMKVFVTSGSADKITRAIDLGAESGVNYTSKDWHKELYARSGGFDLILDSAGGDQFSLLPKICRPGGRIVIYGGSLGHIQRLSPQIIFWRQLSIIGTSMGSPTDFRDMLRFVEDHEIAPVIHRTLEFQDGHEGIEILAESKQFGKIVLQIIG